MTDNEQDTARGVIWHLKRQPWPFVVWEGDLNGSASGRLYRTRLGAIIAAWWASLYAQQDVWIERRPPQLTTKGDSGV